MGKEGYGIEVTFRESKEDNKLDRLMDTTGEGLDDNLKYDLRFDEDFTENMPEDFFEKIVTFPHAMPIIFMVWFGKHNLSLWERRTKFFNCHREIIREALDLSHTEREIREEYGDPHSDLYIIIEFLKKYPEFKQIVSHVEISKHEGDKYVTLEEILLDDFIDNIYYNPYLNEKKHLLIYGFE